MFQKDTYVFYASGGICLVSDIQVAPLSGMPADRSYYILKSVHDPNGVMYVPTDSDKVFLRPLLTAHEAEELLTSLSSVPEIEREDAKQLRAAYAEAMGTHAPRAWVSVIKTVRRRISTDAARGRRLSETERSFAENSRRFLVSELSIALGCTVREAEERLEANL